MGKQISTRLRRQVAALVAVGSVLFGTACTEDDPGGPPPTPDGPPVAWAKF